MAKLTLVQAAAGLASGEFTSRQLIADALAKNRPIRRGKGSELFTQVYADWAQQQALAADQRRAAGKSLSPLDGVPISIKDLFDVSGQVTTAGSRVLAGAAVAKKHAAIVERLLQAGAVVIGKNQHDRVCLLRAGYQSAFWHSS
ncbi:Mandelamide hydrolase [Serratia fonticola]|uniref:Mandelamide hydrolase n=1 Tax=Serratia fonticola TaxID=47917 RepID=A0A4U9UI74_SERFO|nr:Mandelamide hydrolase [Serratia fonticola]